MADEDDGAWTWGALLLPKRPEATAPSYLTPVLASHLWCLPVAKRRSWQRRFVLASANFLYVFSSPSDVKPPNVKPPLHVLCTEDLGFAAQELSAADMAQCPELSHLSEWAFALVPAEASASQFRFCAETHTLRTRWGAVLKRSKCAALGEELRGAKVELECKEQELRELKKVLAEALRRSWREPSREESEASTKVQAAIRGHMARQASSSSLAAASGHAKAPRGSWAQSTTKALGGLTSGAAGLLGTAGAELKGLATGGLVSATGTGAGLVAGGLKGAASGLTHGLKKGAESVKGGVVNVLEYGIERSPPAGMSDARSDALQAPPSGESHAREAPASGSGAAQEAVAALHERGEKLETLKGMTDGLAAQAESLAANAHRLKEEERRKAGFWAS